MFFPANLQKKDLPFLKELFQDLKIKKLRTKKDVFQEIKKFLKGKRRAAVPSFWQLYFVYQRFFKNDQSVSPSLVELLKTVKVRSLSGIVPLSVFTKPEESCPYHCVYCPQAENAPKSYFPDEAAVSRAIRNHYDPFFQTKERLIQFFLSGHPIDKVEMIVQGGTFGFYDSQYREKFIQGLYDGANYDIGELIIGGTASFQRSKSLAEAKVKNERAKSRVVGLTIETRPDFINEQEIIFLRQLGVTRVEMGVQAVDDKILRLVKRGHLVADVARATALLREAGFKITYHLMPGLPGSNLKKDLAMLRQVFNDDRFKPDAIKFYPTQVAYGSELFTWYKQGKFKPMTENDLLWLTKEFKKKIVPHWVRIQRLVRDLTVNDIAVATFPSHFRQKLAKILEREKINCPCIRCREIGGNKISGKIIFRTEKYSASQGIEYFIEAVDGQDRLLGFLRLRIPKFFLEKKPFFIDSLNGAGIVRELHVYGKEISLGGKGKVQHHGIGKTLLRMAEKITKGYRARKIAVIAGVGVREYYRKHGYQLDEWGEYMIKNKL